MISHFPKVRHLVYGQQADRAKLWPSATVQKIISETLASPSISGSATTTYTPTTPGTGSGGITFAKEARDLLISCSVEFITMLSSEANEIAEKDAKKTIASEHITKALTELGFEDYVTEVERAAEEWKASQVVCIPILLSGMTGRERSLANTELRLERRSRARLNKVA